MSEPELPPCGIYRTLRPVGEIPAGRLVYFHNHGDPGPGVYLPERWVANRARFHGHGTTIGGPADTAALEPLAAEGFYRVAEPFYCCEERCHLFEADELVQLGYNGTAEPILFTPELADDVLVVPEMGTRIEASKIERLRLLKVAVGRGSTAEDLH